MKQSQFDVVVIGAGHAGCEAAFAAARMGVSTALVTLKEADLGVMSCNPAIGGLGKGHLVREIDALDGLMGLAADYAGIQFRLLNRKKGPAVQGPRTQADRARYKEFVQKFLKTTENLSIIEGEVVDLNVEDGCVSGVVLKDGALISGSQVVLTAGTFLRGTIHIGDQRKSGGRMGSDPSISLAETLDSLDLPMARLKTGTPPRLDGRTIDWSGLEMQPGDDVPTLFSFMSRAPVADQISCGITYTNESTHDIIRENLSRSAMYGGHIDGVGPRYCPSIEDKVVRFTDKTSHQVFLEPEGLRDSTIYPNGISTSLPFETQVAYVRSISGLENVQILQPGYAIEYDFVDPRALKATLAVRNIEGLYFAGQINGTTGYEEAAAQGLVAGLNAASVVLGGSEVLFSRSNSYIGVMIDDLTTRGVVEPYRMFTSRAEYRLSLRADNADQRLTPLGRELGCVSDRRWEEFSAKMDALDSAKDLLSQRTYSPKDLSQYGFKVGQDGSRRTLMQLLSFPNVTIDDVAKVEPKISVVDRGIVSQVQADALYSNYIERQRRGVEALQRDEQLRIPVDFDFSSIEGLSNELKAKFSASRPENIAQASRVDGATPAALALILAKIKKPGARRA